MKCNQCGKEIQSTNCFSINYNGESIKVCGKHYAQYRKHGHFLDNVQRTCFDLNEFEITDEGVWIYTFNRRQEPSGRFLIDIDDLDKVIVKKWRCWKGDYYTGNFRPIPIYRFLLETDENQVIDHINGNRSDNRRKNLRVCTQQQNLQNKALSSLNTSGVAGVSFDKQRKKWIAEIRFDYKKCFLGRYENIEDATFVRYYAETQLFKEFRSTRNDERILKLIEKCFRKEELKKYVDRRLLEKFNLNAN